MRCSAFFGRDAHLWPTLFRPCKGTSTSFHRAVPLLVQVAVTLRAGRLAKLASAAPTEQLTECHPFCAALMTAKLRLALSRYARRDFAAARRVACAVHAAALLDTRCASRHHA